MSASIGVVDVMEVNAVAPSTRVIETPTASSAVMRGIPAARNEPNVSTSTISATTTPSASMMLRVGISWLNSSPPSDAVAPSGSALCSEAVASSSSVFVESGISKVLPSSWIVMRAASLSSLMLPSTVSSKGESAVSTWSMSFSSSTASSMGSDISASVTLWPSGATTMSCALEPLT